MRINISVLNVLQDDNGLRLRPVAVQAGLEPSRFQPLDFTTAPTAFTGVREYVPALMEELQVFSTDTSCYTSVAYDMQFSNNTARGSGGGGQPPAACLLWPQGTRGWGYAVTCVDIVEPGKLL